MNTEQARSYLEALVASVTIGVILPALLLVVLLSFVGFILWRAQGRQDFDIADLLKDDTNKISTWRFVALMAFALHSAYFYATLFNKPDPEMFLWFAVIWGGTPASIILAEKWNGVLPFARGGPPA